MDDIRSDEATRDPPSTLRRTVRTPRQDRAYVPTQGGVNLARGRSVSLTETPLVVSRSLGPLLGLNPLRFKLESCQPTGSWLDRGVARIVGSAVDAPLGVVGGGPLGEALAAQCARVGRQLVVLVPANTEVAVARLEAFGARIIVVDASLATLQTAAPSILSQIGGRVVDKDDPEIRAGFCELLGELSIESHDDALVALPDLVGREAEWLAETPQDGLIAVPLPLDGLGFADDRRVHRVVGSLSALAGPLAGVVGVIRRPVTRREATAAQRLLAREEGIVASITGAVGLAALIRVVQDDRRVPVRERRIPRGVSGVAVITRDLEAAGSLMPADALLRRAVSLLEVQTGLARLLVTPGGAHGD